MTEQPQLRRTMGLFDVALFFIVCVSNLQWVVLAAGAGPSALVVWVIGCAAMFVPLSIVVVYLTSHHPDEGGMYVWARLAFGPFAGFFTGWTYWASTLSFFAAVLYFAAGNALYIFGGGALKLASSPLYIAMFALAGLAFATMLNAFGLQIGKWLNNIGAIARCISIAIIIGLGAIAWWKFGSATPINAMTIRPGLGLKDIIFWSVIAFALTGPESVPLMAGEIRNPRRSIPLGLAIAAPAIVLIYVLGTLALLVALPAAHIDQTSGIMQAVGAVTGKLGWGALVPVAALLVTVSMMGSAGAWLGSCARLPFVAGIDHYLPSAFGRIHPRWGSPVVALLTLAAIAATLIVLGQSGSSVKSAYDIIVSSTVIATLMPFLVIFAAAIKLYKEPSSPDMVRIPGGRFTVVTAAVIGFTTTLVGTVLAVFPADDEPNKTLAVIKVIGLTLIVIVAGVAIYLAGRRRALQHASE